MNLYALNVLSLNKPTETPKSQDLFLIENTKLMIEKFKSRLVGQTFPILNSEYFELGSMKIKGVDYLNDDLWVLIETDLDLSSPETCGIGLEIIPNKNAREIPYDTLKGVKKLLILSTESFSIGEFYATQKASNIVLESINRVGLTEFNEEKKFVVEIFEDGEFVMGDIIVEEPTGDEQPSN